MGDPSYADPRHGLAEGWERGRLLRPRWLALLPPGHRFVDRSGVPRPRDPRPARRGRQRAEGPAAAGSAQGDSRFPRPARPARHRADRHARAGQTLGPPGAALGALRRLERGRPESIVLSLCRETGRPEGRLFRPRAASGPGQVGRDAPIPEDRHALDARGHGVGRKGPLRVRSQDGRAVARHGPFHGSRQGGHEPGRCGDDAQVSG